MVVERAGVGDTRLFYVTFRVKDEVAFFNAALALGRRRPAALKLRHWLIAGDGRTSYALWEATEAVTLMGILDVEFGDSADYGIEEVNLLYASG
jgi:hypothetical protein